MVTLDQSVGECASVRAAFLPFWRHAACGLRWALEPPPREGACLWLALGTQAQAFPDERKNLAGAGGGGASVSARWPVRASSPTRPPQLQWLGLGPAGVRRGAGR